MKLTRRRFLECTGAVVAGTGLARSAGAARQSQPPRPVAGAPGVELNVAGLPDYSHDLERYLVRLANDARERRQRVVQAITTPQESSTARGQSWRNCGRCWEAPPEKTPLNPRITGRLDRPGYRVEKLTFESRRRLYVTANLYVPSAPGRHPAILGAARTFDQRQGVAELSEAVLESRPQGLRGARV